jgi:histidinol-phosphate aminotransferase
VSTSPDKLIRDDIRALSAYHVQDASGLVKLDAMENPYVLPPNLRREIGDVLAAAEINRYPDAGASELRSALRATMRVPEEFDVLLGNGSDELIQIMINACARPGAAVLAPVPTFVMYRMYALIAGVRFESVSLEQDFSLQPGKILSAIREIKPALVFLSYPNNPTGNLFSDEVMTAILRESPGLVVVDEAYQPFAGSTFLDRLSEFPHLVVLRTLSKLGLAGIRLGYAVARPEWIREFDKVRSPYNVNVLTQLVAGRMLANFSVLERQAALIRADRDALKARLAELPGVRAFPSAANFLLVRVPEANTVFEGLRRRGVLVKNLHGTHPVLEHCLRITVGTPAENQLMLAALRGSLADLGNGAPRGLRVG